ncbi:MAG TPA: hypothetical protein VML95_00065 [Longimicrobiales bacterium]|nr:hypothetical protein [Longimicrobiales bacterium]
MNGEAPPSGPSAAQHHMMMWVVLGSMLVGLVVFAAVAAFLRPAEASEAGTPLAFAWMVFAPLSLLAAWLVHSRAAAGPARPGGVLRGGGQAEAERLRRRGTAHVVAWALVEGQAMLGIVTYLLGGPSFTLWGALLIAALGFAMTAPRHASFELR